MQSDGSLAVFHAMRLHVEVTNSLKAEPISVTARGTHCFERRAGEVHDRAFTDMTHSLTKYDLIIGRLAWTSTIFNGSSTQNDRGYQRLTSGRW